MRKSVQYAKYVLEMKAKLLWKLGAQRSSHSQIVIGRPGMLIT